MRRAQERTFHQVRSGAVASFCEVFYSKKNASLGPHITHTMLLGPRTQAVDETAGVSSVSAPELRNVLRCNTMYQSMYRSRPSGSAPAPIRQYNNRGERQYKYITQYGHAPGNTTIRRTDTKSPDSIRHGTRRNTLCKLVPVPRSQCTIPKDPTKHPPSRSGGCCGGCARLSQPAPRVQRGATE